MSMKRLLTIALLMAFATLMIAGSAVADWQQVNTDGFGNPNNDRVQALVSYGGQIYAGVGNSTTGAEIWRSSDGQTWNRVVSGGFGAGAPNITKIHSLVDFNGQMICAGTGSPQGTNQARVYCSSTGDSGTWQEITWDAATSTELGPRTTSARGIEEMVVFNDTFGNPRLVVSEKNEVNPPDIWVYDGANWDNFAPNNFAAAANTAASDEIFGFVVYQNRLFLTLNDPQMWQADVNMNWGQVTLPAALAWMAVGIENMAVLNNTLYVVSGGIWASNNPLGGAGAWQQLSSNFVPSNPTAAFVDPSRMMVLNNELYIVLNEYDGANNNLIAGVWRSSDMGYNWNRISQFGFGDIGNVNIQALTTFNNTLYAGTRNPSTGAEVWSYDQCDNNANVRVNPIFVANGITVNVPVTVNLANPIDTFSFDLVYDPNILSYQGIDFSAGIISTTAGWGINTIASNPTPGTLRVADFRSGGVSIPAGTDQILIELQFDAAAGANPGNVATFRIENLTGGLSGLSSTDRCTSAVRDQHDGNVDNVTAGTATTVTSTDATEAFNFFLQIPSAVIIPFDDTAQDRADVVSPRNPGSDITPGDAYQINCYAVDPTVIPAGNPVEPLVSANCP